MQNNIQTTYKHIENHWNIYSRYDITQLKEELTDKNLVYDQVKLKNWFNTKKFRENKKKS